jgi:phosphoribosylamine--glycine ligase
MKVLVIGGGAREHAVCWALRRSPRIQEVLCAPGNPGIALVATCIPIEVTAIADLVREAKSRSVDLTVVGPEAALARGIVDAFHAEGLAIVGPTQAAALLESSKSFAKEVMVEAKVPTATYEVFSSRSSVEEYCRSRGAPLVLKADGLASGKGVFVIQDDREFAPAIEALFSTLKVEKVVVEEFLSGFEVSCIFASNGADVVALAPAHDYKRVGDHDTGPNTGGMGSICPTPRISEADLAWIEEKCAKPIVGTMRERGTPFTGFLYAGLMVDKTKPYEQGFKVLEYNTRLGDPECQSIMARLTSDPLELFQWMAGVRTEKPTLTWTPKVATCIVIASDGYPEKPVKGDRISGLEHVSLIPQTVVFHAGTARDAGGTLISTGGRTLSVVALGDTLDESRGSAYKAVDIIQLRGRRVRRDIGS